MFLWSPAILLQLSRQEYTKAKWSVFIVYWSLRFFSLLAFLYREVKAQSQLQYNRTSADGYSLPCPMTLECCKMFVFTFPAKNRVSQVITQTAAAEQPIHISQSQRSHKEKYCFVIQFSKVLPLPEGQLDSGHSLDRLENQNLGSRYRTSMPQKIHKQGLEKLQDCFNCQEKTWIMSISLLYLTNWI